jgi:hypothetical protein
MNVEVAKTRATSKGLVGVTLHLLDQAWVLTPLYQSSLVRVS